MSRLIRPPAPALAWALALGAAGLVGSAVYHSAGPVLPIGGNVAAARPATIVEPISCTKLPDVPGKSITTAVVTFPPAAYSPRHRHPGSVTAYVLQGTVRSQLAGGEPSVFTVGQGWFEPPGVAHLFAENASDREPARLLAVFIADDDCGPLVIPD